MPTEYSVLLLLPAACAYWKKALVAAARMQAPKLMRPELSVRLRYYRQLDTG